MGEYQHSCKPWPPSPQVVAPQDIWERRLDKPNIWSGNGRNRRHVCVPGRNPTVLSQLVYWLTIFNREY